MTYNHIHMGLQESRAATHESRYERWAERVETVIGRSLDGDQIRDGFSLDHAHAAFRAGETSNEYGATICARLALDFRPYQGDAALSEASPCDAPAGLRALPKGRALT